MQASMLTQTVTGPVGPVTPRIYSGPAQTLLVLQIFLKYKKKKHCIKSTANIYFYLFHLHLFQKHLACT